MPAKNTFQRIPKQQPEASRLCREPLKFDRCGSSCGGRAFVVGSRAHADLDPAAVSGSAGDWVYEGQERDPPGPGVQRRKQNFAAESFWARGYMVSTVGRDEKIIRAYIRNQGEEDKQLDQMSLWR